MNLRCRVALHDWSQDCGRCARCGSPRSPVHSWRGEACSVCGVGLTQLVDFLWDEFQRALPGIPVHTDRCKEYLTHSLRGGASVQSAAAALAKALKKKESSLVDQDLVCMKVVGAIWEQLRLAMPGIFLIEESCKARLTEEVKSGKSPEEATMKLVKDMKDNPRRYMILPSPPKHGRLYDSCRSCRGCCP